MQPLQFLNNIPHILHTRPQALTNLLLSFLIDIQKSLNEFSIHETEWFCSLSFSILEGTVGVEIHVAECLDYVAHAAL